MVDKTANEIRQAVSSVYGDRARAVVAGNAASCCDAPAADVKQKYYSGEGTEGMPDSVVSYGCGNPVAIAGLRTGESVLDLGSGAGLDCFLAAQRVGPEGRVIGLDMTDEMLALAKQNKAKLGVANVEFRKGVMESMPLGDAAVDVIISNCVINLSPDKDAVLAEAFRVLRPGGRMHVSDVVLMHEPSAAEQQDLILWAGCISGALEREDYRRRLLAAGFVDVSIAVEEPGENAAANAWRSARITAYRPGGEAKPLPARLGERIELLAPAGLETAACCGPDCCSTNSVETSDGPE